MPQLLEDLYDRLFPPEDPSDGEESEDREEPDAVRKLIAETLEVLKDHLADEQLFLLSEFLNVQANYEAEINRERFVRGFSYGVSLMIESLLYRPK